MKIDSTATDGYWENSVFTMREYELKQENQRLRGLLDEIDAADYMPFGYDDGWGYVIHDELMDKIRLEIRKEKEE
jgi:hypothetical protein